MVPLICPNCETLNRYQKIFEGEPVQVTCPSCSHEFTPSADELFSTLRVLDEKLLD